MADCLEEAVAHNSYVLHTENIEKKVFVGQNYKRSEVRQRKLIFNEYSTR